MSQIRYEVSVLQKTLGKGETLYKFRVLTYTTKFVWRRFQFEEHAVSREVLGSVYFHWADTGHNISHTVEPILYMELAAARNLFNDKIALEALSLP